MSCVTFFSGCTIVLKPPPLHISLHAHAVVLFPLCHKQVTRLKSMCTFSSVTFLDTALPKLALRCCIYCKSLDRVFCLSVYVCVHLGLESTKYFSTCQRKLSGVGLRGVGCI